MQGKFCRFAGKKGVWISSRGAPLAVSLPTPLFPLTPIFQACCWVIKLLDGPVASGQCRLRFGPGCARRAGSWERGIQVRSTNATLPYRALSQTGRIRCCVGACCQDAEPQSSNRCQIGFARHQKGYPVRISRGWLGYLEAG